MEPTERIREMEEILQAAKDVLTRLDDALEDYAALWEKLRALDRYYGGADWRADLARDEAGLFPATLRRGVLSEDEVYNLLSDERRVLEQMRQLLAANTEREDSP